jgi:hypothetical protein
MGEYLLHIWGGFFNKEHRVKHGKKPGYYWFTSPEARESFFRELQEIEERLDARFLARSDYDGPLVRKRTIAQMIFIYKGTKYPFEYDFGYGYEESSAEYMFFDGNYSCDCNRSIFIRRGHPDFPELNCGEKIALKDFKIIYREGSGAPFELSE